MIIANGASAGERMTPETLWAMGRIGACEASPDGKKIVYQVSYYSVEANKGHHMLKVVDADGGNAVLLTTTDDNETDATWIDDSTLAFLSGGNIWTMAADGSGRKQLSTSGDIDGYKFSPDGKKVLLVKSIPFHEVIKKNPDDLPKATGRLVTDLMYRHWDHYVETIPHPFIADVNESGIGEAKDILAGEPYECPMEPFGGIEQLDWSVDGRTIAYTCRKKVGVEYAISTDADIYLYDIETGKSTNICKCEGYVEPAIDPTHTMADQEVNSDGNMKNNPGYDTNPLFSPCGKYVAWQSMARNGYESDRNRLCVYDLATGEKVYVTESLDTNVDAFCWSADGKSLFFTAVWHGKTNVYSTNLKGEVKKLTDDVADYVSVSAASDGKKLICMRQSMSAPTDIYSVSLGKKSVVTQITNENKEILDKLDLGRVDSCWISTTDGKEMLTWIVLPSGYEEGKKYPTLLFCEGGPQSPVSQFWSYRWNFQIMAAHGYVVIAPNRHGLPGFGTEWNEQISGDWTGQCMADYLSATDYAAANLPYVDSDNMAAVGASFGGFSVYYLAGIHEKRFKCFIAHDGAFNLESMYTDTEEAWFSNWEYDDAFWNEELTANAERTYARSPHRNVSKWDTPILCIHGEKDYRINYNQGMGAFNAARMMGIPAELLIFPDENHWVLKPQNGILWQRTYFNWLSRWLKK